MKAFFLNIFVVMILMGITTRLLNHFLKKIGNNAYLVTFVICLVGVIPLVSMTVGYDAAIFIYLVCLLVWLLIDYLHAQVKKK